jgi:hypothetical protein
VGIQAGTYHQTFNSNALYWRRKDTETQKENVSQGLLYPAKQTSK